jgi:hypothetical protein
MTVTWDFEKNLKNIEKHKLPLSLGGVVLIMTIVTFTRKIGTGLTSEELSMLEEAEKFSPVYDNDSPKLTREQLSEFRPAMRAVN